VPIAAAVRLDSVIADADVARTAERLLLAVARAVDERVCGLSRSPTDGFTSEKGGRRASGVSRGSAGEFYQSGLRFICDLAGAPTVRENIERVEIVERVNGAVEALSAMMLADSSWRCFVGWRGGDRPSHAMSPRILTMSRDNPLLGSVKSCAPLRQTNPMISVALSPDGLRVSASSSTGSVLAWKTAPAAQRPRWADAFAAHRSDTRRACIIGTRMAARFETTNWSVIVRASASITEVRQNALAELCQAYWYPLYAFARGRGGNHDDASDLTQAFLAHLIEKHALSGLTPNHGRFRAFLLASFKNFQSDASDRAHTLKRGGDWIRISWDAEVLESRYWASVRTGEDPEQLFERQWALTVIDRARERLRAQHVEAGKVREFDALWPFLVPDRDEISTDGLAKALDTTAGAARVALHRFRRRFGAALRAEIASTVDDAGQVESELRFLLEVLAHRNTSGP